MYLDFPVSPEKADEGDGLSVCFECGFLLHFGRCPDDCPLCARDGRRGRLRHLVFEPECDHIFRLVTTNAFCMGVMGTNEDFHFGGADGSQAEARSGSLLQSLLWSPVQ